MGIQDILGAILGDAGIVVMLLVILWSGWRGYWVFGWYAKEMRTRNDDLERKLDRALGLAERGTGQAERALAEGKRLETQRPD